MTSPGILGGFVDNICHWNEFVYQEVPIFIIDNSLLIIVSLFCIMLLSVLIKQYCLLIVSPFTSFSLGE